MSRLIFSVSIFGHFTKTRLCVGILVNLNNSKFLRSQNEENQNEEKRNNKKQANSVNFRPPPLKFVLRGIISSR